MSGNVWASPLGDVLVTRGGDVFTTGATHQTDMIYWRTLTQSLIADLQWDTERSEIVTVEGAFVRRYRLDSYALLDSRSLQGTASFVGKRGARIFAVRTANDSTLLDEINVNRPPTAVAAVASGTVECTGQSGATVRLDGSSSSDPDDVPGVYQDLVSFAWVENLGQPGELLLGEGAILEAFLTTGVHLVTLVVTDADGASSTSEQTILVVDTTDPMLSVPAPASLECSTYGGASATHAAVQGWLQAASASDDCGTVTLVHDAPPLMPLGDTVVTFTAVDAAGHSTTRISTITVADTTPPEILVTMHPQVLWPPNHRMVDVRARVSASDLCGRPSVVLDSVTSNEADGGTGDGDTVHDIQGVTAGTDDYQFLLRAERVQAGSGRTYTALYTVTDAAGNHLSATGSVVVPLDQPGRVPGRTPGRIEASRARGR
jgi:hypothetical protein